MSPEVGAVVKGKVIKITKFGAFVELEDGSEGLIHISQIANQFIKDVSEYLQINKIVKVKILGIDKKGYCELSIKEVQKTQEYPEKLTQQDYSFEEKLASFLKESEERLLDLKRNIEAKRRGGGRIKY